MASSSNFITYIPQKNLKITDKYLDNQRYGLIFNTVPSLIFDRSALELLNKDVLIIDLASKPGGVDFDCASSLGLRFVWALGLPGKIAPITSGEIIADSICGIINERSEPDA